MPFPQRAPFRVDQVMAAPGLMTGLWLVLVLLALVLSWAGHTGRRRCWWAGAGLFLGVVALFFTLASWGTSDITKLSHFYAFDRGRLPPAEPLWPLLTPLVLALPYRMAAMQGLVAAAYAAVPLLLSRLGAWGGWWALLIVCSPLQRSFLQNGITRQALAVLLLVPLMLWCSGQLGRRRLLVLSCTVLAALSHTTFPINLLAALVPALVRFQPAAGSSQLSAWWNRALAAAGHRSWKAVGLGLGALLFALLLALPLAMVLPVALQKFQLYSQRETFFSSYPILKDVLRLEIALLVAVALVLAKRGLNPIRVLRHEGLARQMLLYGVLLALIQVSVFTGWLAPITFRLADLVGLFLLLSFLVWIREHRIDWAVLPPLAVTLVGWLQHRLLDVEMLRCGLDDNFLCIPDRWPWLIQY